MGRLVYLLAVVVICALSCQGQSSVRFSVENVPLNDGQTVGIRGSLPPLSWDKSILLEKQNNKYSIDLTFSDTEEELEFKFVIDNKDNETIWENIQNRNLNLKESPKLESNSSWNKEQVIDVLSLRPIPSELLLQDYELISTMILDVHPGTYRYNTEEQINLALKELKSKFSKSLSYQDAYLAISKLTAQIRCDHTKAGFNNQNKIINSIIHYQPDKLPFTFKWVNDEMVVIRNASDSEALVKGTKVLSINQVPVLDIRNKMLDYIGADGNTDNNRIYKTEVSGYDFRYSAFDIFYPLLYPTSGDIINLEIQNSDDYSVDTIRLKMLTRVDRFSILSERYESFPKSRDDMWNFEVLTDNTAILTLNSFGLYGWKAMTLDYKAFLSNAFNQMDILGIENLIIDIRENTGGNDEMSEELFKYLVNGSLNLEREGRTRYVTFPEVLKPYIKTWGDEPWYFNLNPKDKEPINGYYIFKEDNGIRKKSSKYKIFNGNVYLLSSSANTSLAYYTVARFRLQSLGIIVGQETGGNLNDINGGQILFLTLPNSGIEIDFPVMGSFTLSPQPNSGVKPDIEINYNIEDIIKGSDLEVQAIMKLIE